MKHHGDDQGRHSYQAHCDQAYPCQQKEVTASTNLLLIDDGAELAYPRLSGKSIPETNQHNAQRHGREGQPDPN